MKLSQKQFNELQLAERLESGTILNMTLISKPDSMLQEIIPMYKTSMILFDEIIFKYIDACFNSFSQHNARLPQYSESIEHMLFNLGKMAYKESVLIKKFAKEAEVNNSIQSLENWFILSTLIDDFNKSA